MEKDKLYIDNNNRAITVELPEYGEVSLLIKDGKVVKYDVLSSHLLTEKDSK